MRNPIAVLLLLASTAVLAAPTFVVEQDTGPGTYQSAAVETSNEAAVMAPELLITACPLVLVPRLDNQVELVPASLADCNSVRPEKVTGIQLRPMVRDYKPHGHWPI